MSGFTDLEDMNPWAPEVGIDARDALESNTCERVLQLAD